jgi:hypothetical protein
MSVVLVLQLMRGSSDAQRDGLKMSPEFYD